MFLCIHIQTYIHTCMHAYIHTHTYIHYITLDCISLHYITSHYITLPYIHTCMHACIHTYLCICSETVRSLVSATAVQDTELKALPNPPARTMPERGSLGVEASKRTNGFTVRGTALAGGACSNEHSTARNNFQIHRFDPTCPQHSATWDQVGAGRLLPCNKAGTWAQLGPTWLQLSTLLGLAEAWFSSMFAMLGLRWAYSNQAGPSCAGLTWLGSACAYHGFNLGPPGSAWPQNHANTCKYTENQVVWTITIRTLNLDLVPRSCKYIVNQVVCRKRIPKLNLDLAPKSCKNSLNQVVWRNRIRKVRFSKLNLVPKYRHRQNYGNANRLC